MMAEGDTPENCLTSWMKDTCSIYRVGMIRLGCALVFLGVASMSIGGALLGLNHGAAWAGIGLWMGLPSCVAGGMCLIYRKTRPREKLSVCSVCCIVCAICASFNVATSASNVYGALQDRQRWFPKFPLEADVTVLVVLNAVLVAVSLLSLCFCIWAATVTVGMVCSCYSLWRHRVFTIPFGALEEEPADAPAVSGPDIAQLDPFPRLSNGAPVLQLCYIEEEDMEEEEGPGERDNIKLKDP